MTQHILVINIKKIKNSATCFGSLSHHQAKNKVLVHSVIAYTMGFHVCLLFVFLALQPIVVVFLQPGSGL